MKKQKSLSILAATVALGTLLAGCGGGQSSAPQSNSGGGSTSGGGAGEKLVIAVVGPMSGQYSDYGSTAKAGAEYALKEKQEAFKALGFDVQLSAQDDQADPKQGVAVAQMLISNPDVVGVVGHATTGASITAAAQYDQEKLVMVSPSATGSDLTEQGKKIVHRICARDDQQGSKAAIYAKNQLGVKSAFIMHDKAAYGQGLAEEVKKQFEADGVQIVGFEGVTAGEKDYSAVINQIVSKNPEMIYFGGYYSDAGIIVKQAREKGFKGIFMGGDGYDSADLVKIAGAENANNVVFTSTVGDVGATEEGKKWIEDFEKSTGNKVGIFTSFGYDSMGVMLNGLEEAIKANGGKKPTREQVLEAVHKTKDYKGKFVNVTFNDKGDNEFASVYVYKYEDGKKVYIGEAK
ncbi:branched chain amino acid ABC transporter substrate-binding protein [Brevibacillus agri]|uniref:Branched-chain amino acid ABC transporter substrate-binding protein n=1 Tax=Brevibacillus agri TaxID=51101 RepID=A0A3M8AFC4_9BACL|nr:MULTISPECIES: branched-chain amino acid ABC transporter substrate-binding protein [Brevibacillus]ELK43866.1 ABC transporter substrate-binding protein [Brevibacillus agri BAB-2500]MBY0053312.1 branched-chain amino acid ABC transporter substrate-binding protein [Brevibacillus agri]MCG5253423.1 branched-chain amino acid ABC transporter substrate-binding protein [Brevibacillus agri]MDN4095052.1 branched-chain amino acid ABC transporter substrate-binding protein [Brevibacillus agri]MED1646498.1 